MSRSRKTPFVLLLWSILGSTQPLFLHAAEEDDVVNTIRIPDAGSIEPAVVATREYDDPWQAFNRRVFVFNDVAYRYALIPLAHGYTAVLPEPVRNGIGRVFSNLREPLYALNNGMQGQFALSGRNVARFLVNSTIGIVGILDPATHWLGIAAHTTTLNETLAQWDVAPGPFLVLPLLGPTDLRRGGAGSVETLVHPLRFLVASPQDTVAIAFDNFQGLTPGADNYLILRDQSTDPYIYFRNQYLQGRERDEDFGDESQ